MTRRVLITGARGFIGRQALPILRERGFDVHAVARKSGDEPGVTWHEADLLAADERQQIMTTVRPTHILHFAWIATPGVYWTSPLNTDWLAATRDLLVLAARAGTARFVGAGSCAEYDWSAGHCDERTTPLAPATPYGEAKAACGTDVMAAAELSTAWGRIFHLYGPWEHPSRLVPSVMLPLLKNERARCTHGGQVRDLLHVRDVADAFVAVLESDVRGAVNIASGIPVTIRDVVTCIARQMGKVDDVDFGAIDPPANDSPQLTAATQRLEQEVGWRPSFTLETGIADTIAWWKRHGSR